MRQWVSWPDDACLLPGTAYCSQPCCSPAACSSLGKCFATFKTIEQLQAAVAERSVSGRRLGSQAAFYFANSQIVDKTFKYTHTHPQRHLKLAELSVVLRWPTSAYIRPHIVWAWGPVTQRTRPAGTYAAMLHRHKRRLDWAVGKLVPFECAARADTSNSSSTWRFTKIRGPANLESRPPIVGFTCNKDPQ